MFTTQHYEKIAQVVAQIDNLYNREEMAHRFAFMLRQDNPNFSHETFFTACGLNFWCAPDVFDVIHAMKDQKRAYARSMWLCLANGEPFPQIPPGMTITEAADIVTELTQYDTKTGNKLIMDN